MRGPKPFSATGQWSPEPIIFCFCSIFRPRCGAFSFVFRKPAGKAVALKQYMQDLYCFHFFFSTARGIFQNNTGLQQSYSVKDISFHSVL